MSSETVSDERLDHVIQEIVDRVCSTTTVWALKPHGAPFPNEAVRGILHSILDADFAELKALRAQQAEPPAGCAEMATTIEKAIADADESGFDEGRCGIIAAKLAPLFTLLAECRKVIGEYRSLCECELYPECRHCCITREFLQRIDAALGKGDAAVKGGG